VAVSSGLEPRIDRQLRWIQNELFHLGSDLCVLEEDKEKLPVPTIEERHVLALEHLMDELSDDLEPLQNFVLPGGSPGAAHLHVARTICRRAERDLVTLAAREPVGEFTVRYLNRLGDALFVMARWQNARQNVGDVLWDSRA
jgi:cob(I)alamin adenosyltransferase